MNNATGALTDRLDAFPTRAPFGRRTPDIIARHTRSLPPPQLRPNPAPHHHTTLVGIHE